MVAIHNTNYLCFSIPKLHDEVSRLVNSEVDRVMDRLLREDPVQAFNAMLNGMRAWESELQAAGHKVQLPEAEIEFARTMVPLITADDIYQAVFKCLPLQFPCMFLMMLNRNLRIPENGKSYDIPSYISDLFPMELVDDHAARLPTQWTGRSGVIVPVTQAEAIWIFLNYSGYSSAGYPCALKMSVGNINAMTGEISRPGLESNPQNHFVLPNLSELYCYRAGRNFVRQLTAPQSAQEQGPEHEQDKAGDIGEVRFEVFPLKPALYLEDYIKPCLPQTLEEIMYLILGLRDPGERRYRKCRSMAESSPYYIHDPWQYMDWTREEFFPASVGNIEVSDNHLGMGIFQNLRPPSHYDTDLAESFSLHLCTQTTWRACTGAAPPPSPVTEALYKKCDVPWYNEYGSAE